MSLRLIRGPFLISAVLTLVRLGGELGNVSDRWFQRSTGGLLPSGVGWILGISWLPVLFGPYFFDRLKGTRDSPTSIRVFLFGVLGAVFVLSSFHFLLPSLPLPFPMASRHGRSSS
jgi:hypothetical protein